MNDTRRSAGVFALTACAALAISASAAEATNQQDCKLVVTGSITSERKSK